MTALSFAARLGLALAAVVVGAPFRLGLWLIDQAADVHDVEGDDGDD